MKIIFTSPVGKRRQHAKGEQQRRRRRSNTSDSTDVLVADAQWPRPVVFRYSSDFNGTRSWDFVFRFLSAHNNCRICRRQFHESHRVHALTSHDNSTDNRLPVGSLSRSLRTTLSVVTRRRCRDAQKKRFRRAYDTRTLCTRVYGR